MKILEFIFSAINSSRCSGGAAAEPTQKRATRREGEAEAEATVGTDETT